MKIGHYEFSVPIVLAPMAGVSDKPFRVLCRYLGADYCVSEMVTSQVALWKTKKTRVRLPAADEKSPRITQIVGGDPGLMAECASLAYDLGAEIVDINMGCPAKKVCRKVAGSALLADPKLVSRILSSVVKAVDCPVTLKMRTGTSTKLNNGLVIAEIAEGEGIAALTVHGRSKQCRYDTPAEYGIISEIKSRVSIPVLANGDIVDGASALKVLRTTGADGLMIGRAAQGNPWVFFAIQSFVNGTIWEPPKDSDRLDMLYVLVESLYEHYGLEKGIRIARKHVHWFLEHIPSVSKLASISFKKLESCSDQMVYIGELKNQIKSV